MSRPGKERTATTAPGGYRSVPAEGISRRDIDQDAMRVLSRLQRNGFEAYLVGGCVRDLLLGRTPKDFDVATAAHPRQIKRLFRNGRIIGRRFRLVHVVYGKNIIETATFRREPPAKNGDEDDLLIREDNEFGTAEEDARRRDFTINGLFLDPTAGVIHDWVGGLEDLERGVLRTIGTPRIRIAEDPVRILRAIKFATRLGLRIEDETWNAMRELAPELRRSAPPRVLEEILRLMRSGTALGAFRMMRACGALAALLPSIDAFLGSRDDRDVGARDRADTFWRLLEALDADVHAGSVPKNSVLLAVLFLRLVEQRAAEAQERDEAPPDWGELAAEELDPMALAARLPRRAVEEAKRILAVQKRFTQSSRKNFRPLLFLRSKDFPDALDLFRLRSAAWGQGWDLYEAWKERYAKAMQVPEEELAELRAKAKTGKKRRRRRRRRRSR
ncbi:MAG TPA: polynucleotide adenylyltransferase PcnB [Planctomycetes bacterium]|nr:polynucleotide adenylyltransferase PcnB [Planctomycetota bacterium]